jgi:hypothetical protein
VIERSRAGRENEWTIWGEPAAVREMFASANTEVRSVTPLTLGDAVITLLSMDGAA